MIKWIFSKIFNAKSNNMPVGQTQQPENPQATVEQTEPMLMHLNINRSTGDSSISINTALKNVDINDDIQSIRAITGEKKVSIKIIHE